QSGRGQGDGRRERGSSGSGKERDAKSGKHVQQGGSQVGSGNRAGGVVAEASAAEAVEGLRGSGGRAAAPVAAAVAIAESAAVAAAAVPGWDAAVSSPETTILQHSISPSPAPPSAPTAFLDRLWSQLKHPLSPPVTSPANNTDTSDVTSTSTSIGNCNGQLPAVSSSVSGEGDGMNGTNDSSCRSQVLLGTEAQLDAVVAGRNKGEDVGGEGTVDGTPAAAAGSAAVDSYAVMHIH
ncbi:unnamed protein product, partial [Closterium sp. NIES-65]